MLFLYFASINILFRLFIFYLTHNSIYHWRVAAMGICNDIMGAAVFYLAFCLLWIIIRSKLLRFLSVMIFTVAWTLINFINYEFVESFNRLLPLSWFKELISYSSDMSGVSSIAANFINPAFVIQVVLPVILLSLIFKFKPSFFQVDKKRYFIGIVLLGWAAQIVTLEPTVTPVRYSPIQNLILKEWYYGYETILPKERKAPLAKLSDNFKKVVIDQEIDKNWDLPPIKNKKPNILFLQMEHFRAFELGAFGSKLNLSPNFDRYAKKGTLYKNIFASGWLTRTAQFSVLCGGYPQPAGEVLLDFQKHDLKCLPDYLKERGYDTWWFHSQAATYDNQGTFLRKHGVDHIMDRITFPSDATPMGWGLSDEDLMKHTLNNLDNIKEPFFLHVQTQTNHAPWIAPPEFTKDRGYAENMNNFFNTYNYADFALGYFLDNFLKTEKGKNTLIVIYGDHGNGKEFVERERVKRHPILQGFNIPLLIIYPENERKDKPAELSTIGSLSDVMPTVLDLLKIDQSNPVFGKSLTRHYKHRFVKGLIQGSWITNGEKFYHSGQVYDMAGKTVKKSSDDKMWFNLIKEIEDVQDWVVRQNDQAKVKDELVKKGWYRFN